MANRKSDMADQTGFERRRRVLLRGIIAGGCIPLVPMLWSCSKDDKAPPPMRGSADGGAPAGAQPDTVYSGTQTEITGQMAGPIKVSKEQAKYQNSPMDDQHCSMCINFVAESNQCKRVEGPIDPKGWCTLWAAKPT